MGSTQRRLHQRPGPTLAVVGALLAGALLGACSGTGSTAGTTMTSPGASTGGDLAARAGMHHAPADASAAWGGRPAYTGASEETEQAYAYALFHPEAVAYMPCYCGCEAMDHRSNLDCYLKRSADGAPTQFEEHASYCEICVETTLLTKQLLSEGKSLREIRAAVDSTFGGRAPGTPTELPPA